jgi:TolB-like protein
MSAMFKQYEKRNFSIDSKGLRLYGKSILGFNTRLLSLLCFILVLLVMPSCIQNQATDASAKKSAHFPLNGPQAYSAILESSYYAADNLSEGLRFRNFAPDMPILAASFVNIDNLEQSSTLGRTISEQIASRLAQQGFKIIETKLRQGSIFIQKGKGEFLLSRDLLNLSINQGAQGVLVGTYAVSEHFIFVSARIVRTEDSSVIMGYDYELPQDKTTRSMLSQ